MRTFASEMVSKYRLETTRNSQGDKIYAREFLSHSKTRIVTLEQLYGCKECCLKIKTYYKNGKVECGMRFGIVDDVFDNKYRGDEYERE